MAIKCKVCDDGDMKVRTKHRMSAIVVLIGYLILIPCLIGMAMGVMLTFATGKAVSEPTPAPTLSAVEEKKLTDAGVPANVVAAINTQQPLTGDLLRPLTTEQRDAATHANNLLSMEISGQNIGKGVAGAVGIGAGVVMIVGSLVGGLLGWLLVMKKKVLQCNSCSAVVAAS